MIKKYRKKPVEVEVAGPINSSNVKEIARWCNGTVRYQVGIDIGTLEGVMNAGPGDYVIKGTRGEFYPCKPYAFADTFEEVV